MSQRDLIKDVMDLVAQIRAGTQLPEEQELLAVAINALLFITSTGQNHVFEDFLEHLESGAPPLVVAAFDTREEAETWLSNHPEPPASAWILIADEYHIVVYVRKSNIRHIAPHAALHYHLRDLKRAGLPPPMASFNTREEAQDWLQNEANPPRQAVIRIAGEPYLAVHHRNVSRRSIYPFSLATAVEVQSEDDSQKPKH